MSERAKPFVAMMDIGHGGLRDGWHRPYRRAYVEPFTRDDALTPCVVTPLLPDDPRPGDKMTWGTPGLPVMVMGAPWNGMVPVIDERGVERHALLTSLRRPPALKTFRVTLDTKEGWSVHREIQAESREAALAKLADALEEVP